MRASISRLLQVFTCVTSPALVVSRAVTPSSVLAVPLVWRRQTHPGQGSTYPGHLDSSELVLGPGCTFTVALHAESNAAANGLPHARDAMCLVVRETFLQRSALQASGGALSAGEVCTMPRRHPKGASWQNRDSTHWPQ